MREEITAGVRIKLTDQIAIGGQTRRDLSADETIANQAGLIYTHPCLILAVGFEQRFTPDAELGDETAFLFRIAFKNLADFETGGSLFGSESILGVAELDVFRCSRSVTPPRRCWPPRPACRPVALAQAGAQRIAAVVNDDVITTQDLIDRINLGIATSGLPNDDATRQRLAPQVLRGFIDEKLQLQEAKRLGTDVTERRDRPGPGRPSPSATGPPRRS